MIPEQLVIFAGKGAYPEQAFAGARAAGVKRIVVAGIRGLVSRQLVKAADEVQIFGIGELGRALAWLETTGIKHMMLVGQITPIALFRSRFDTLTRQLLRSLKSKNAHTIFGAIIEEVEKRGTQVIPASCFMGAHLPGAGLLTERPLTIAEQTDIEMGMKVALGVCDMDIGQTILVKDGVVLAVEAFEGTNATLKRGAKIGGKGAVMIKVAKNGHDMRFDIPVFGEHTLRRCKKYGITALAFQAGRLVMLERDKLIALANRFGIALYGVESNLPYAPLEV